MQNSTYTVNDTVNSVKNSKAMLKINKSSAKEAACVGVRLASQTRLTLQTLS